MKVLLVNGSPNEKGCTYTALQEVGRTLEGLGIEAETFWIGKKPIGGCIACHKCWDIGRCVFNDVVNEFRAKALTADGFVFGSPVFYGQPNGALLAVVQRLLFSNGQQMRFKPVANVAVCRRGGATAAFQTMNMAFEMMNMPIVTSQYWNIAYGRNPGEAADDAEGMQTMRTLARNMAWLLSKLRAEGEDGRPELEAWTPTSFIR